MHPSNTPPDGDFVKYLERLTAGKPAPGAQAALFACTAFLQQLGELARRAAEEAQKSQKNQPKK